MCRSVGSVLQATTNRSALNPLVMNVLDPLTAYSSPSRTAVVRMAARSDPAPGSVMAMAVISSPLQIPGSQRAFWSSSAPARKYGRQVSLWRRTQAALAPTPAAQNSSFMTALNRKSVVPPPPYSSGAAMPRNPASPALRNIVLSTIPARSHPSTWGRTSFSTKARKASRKSSWVSS